LGAHCSRLQLPPPAHHQAMEGLCPHLDRPHGPAAVHRMSLGSAHDGARVRCGLRVW
jgi:hypothetical protein